MQPHEHASAQHYMCNGQVWQPGGGSWIGHFLPGFILLLGGLHWTSSAMTAHLAGKSYTAAAFQGVYSSRARRFVWQQVEPWFKVVLPLLAMYLEWTLSGTQQLICPTGSTRAGAPDVQHINSFSHMTNYPTVILSGLVDLLSMSPVLSARLKLPAATSHVFLGFSFASNAFLMLAHGKHAALDAAVHQYLGAVMAVVALLVLCEGVWRHGFLLSWAKSAALMVEGAWFLAITHIMFEPDPFWGGGPSSNGRLSWKGDDTPLMVLPLLLAWIVLGVVLLQLGMFLALAWVLPTPGSSPPSVYGSRPAGHAARKPAELEEGLQLLPRAVTDSS